MPNRPAILNEALDEVQVYPARPIDIRAVYPDLQLGTLMTDASFAEYPRVVLVRDDDPEPALTLGQRVAAPSPEHVEQLEDGHWHRLKTVIEPNVDQETRLRQQLLQTADELAKEKRQELTSAHLLTFIELDRLAADPSPAPANYPLIRAIALGRSDAGQATTFQQAAAGVENFRETWVARAAAIERKYREIITRINQASTLAEAKAILDELEALE
jgi:hypothetical protein